MAQNLIFCWIIHKNLESDYIIEFEITFLETDMDNLTVVEMAVLEKFIKAGINLQKSKERTKDALINLKNAQIQMNAALILENQDTLTLKFFARKVRDECQTLY